MIPPAMRYVPVAPHTGGAPLDRPVLLAQIGHVHVRPHVRRAPAQHLAGRRLPRRRRPAPAQHVLGAGAGDDGHRRGRGGVQPGAGVRGPRGRVVAAGAGVHPGHAPHAAGTVRTTPATAIVTVTVTASHVASLDIYTKTTHTTPHTTTRSASRSSRWTACSWPSRARRRGRCRTPRRARPWCRRWRGWTWGSRGCATRWSAPSPTRTTRRRWVHRRPRHPPMHLFTRIAR
jgi:hypothetical protein